MDIVVYAVGANEPVLLLLELGILLCSLLCVAVAFRNGGELLQRQSIMLLCQLYLVLAGLLQVYSAGGRVLAQTAGFVLMGIGIAPIFFRKINFDAARYCIGFGATLAAVVVLFV